MATTLTDRELKKDTSLTRDDGGDDDDQLSRHVDGIVAKPYWSWWNPHLPWLDLLVSYLLSFVLPFHRVTKYSATSEEACTANDELQTKFCNNMKSPYRQGCQQWNKMASAAEADAGLVQCTWRVPRRSSILHEWGIIDEQDPILAQIMNDSTSDNDDFVTVDVTCPASLVLKEADDDDDNNTTRRNDCGCVEVPHVDLKDLPRDVPVVIWFHGGGLTLGTSKDAGAVQKILKVLQAQQKAMQNESETSVLPPLVLASVDYRMAPRHPLPAASIDALSVLDYCLKSDPSRKIHVSGESAGGYLSLVSAFAGHRHDPGRIQSALVMIPFISPAADSMSYFLHGPSSKLVDVSWLRWCWRAALELNEDDVDSSSGTENEDQLAIGSNRTAWNKSKWKQSEDWHKFLEPMAGIPPGLDDERGPAFIVAVNKADPLYDEGNELATKLKERGARVDYLEALGSHSVGFEVDRKGHAQLMDLWRAAIFENRTAS